MPAHIIFDKVDSKPASLSSVWLKTLLRTKYKFAGKVFSDCLSMKGAEVFAKDPVARVKLAFEAGCDTVLFCNDPSGVEKVLNQIV